MSEDRVHLLLLRAQLRAERAELEDSLAVMDTALVGVEKLLSSGRSRERLDEDRASVT